MGQGHSFTEEELTELQKGNTLTQAQILKLHKRFRKLDKDGNGEISREEFHAIPALSSNPLLDRVLAVFDTNNDHNVDFREFVRALAIFSHDVDKRDKLMFTFKMYDMDGDNKISNKDLFRTLQIMVGSNLTDIQLQQIVDKTFIEADLDRDGYISFDEFERVVMGSDYGDKLTLQF
jgi:serine/threonine-protein phosphatase 2B regulatory subunit